MKTIYLPGCIVVMNDNPASLPEERRIEESCYSLIETALGRSVSDFDKHFNAILLFTEPEDKAAQVQVINNFRYLLDNLLNKQYSAASLAFAVCVEGVDGIPVTDYTEEGLTELLKQLSAKGLTDEILIRELGDVKKKSIPV